MTAPRDPRAEAGRWSDVMQHVVLLAVLLGAWEVAARRGAIDPTFFGQPSGVAAFLYQNVFVAPKLWIELCWTLLGTFASFALGAAAAIATGHDVLVTAGLFSVFHLDFSLTAVAALLTLAGYSINDTVVVFDRIRENRRKYKRMGLKDMINLSTNQMLTRTILTSVATSVSLIPLLMNQNLRMSWRGADFWLAGVDDVFDGRPDFVAASAGIPAGAFSILLAHAPDLADNALGHGFALLVVTAVNVHAISHMKEGLGYSLAQASLVIMVMTVAQAAGLLLGALVGDRWEKRYMAAACMVAPPMP